jgi:nucleoside-diphosphate-sugar epimerase
VTLGLYAATSKYLNRPLVFPGSDVTYNLKYDFSSSQNNAKFQLFAIRNPKAYDSIFNIHDGTSYTWAEIWEKTARWVDRRSR